MSQPAQRTDRPEGQRRYRLANEPYRPGQPLRREDLDELGDGGPWESDEEFERWLTDLRTLRRAS